MSWWIAIIAISLYWYCFSICIRLDDIHKLNETQLEVLCKILNSLHNIENNNTLHK